MRQLGHKVSSTDGARAAVRQMCGLWTSLASHLRGEQRNLYPRLVERALLRAFEDIVQRSKEDGEHNALVRVLLEHTSLTSDSVIEITLLRELQGVHILNQIERLCQSNREIWVGEDLRITMGVIHCYASPKLKTSPYSKWGPQPI